MMGINVLRRVTLMATKLRPEWQGACF